MSLLLRLVFSLLFIILFLPKAKAATPAQVTAAQTAGITWLLNNQNQDGSWKSGSGMAVAATSEVLQALADGGVRSYGLFIDFIQLLTIRP